MHTRLTWLLLFLAFGLAGLLCVAFYKTEAQQIACPGCFKDQEPFPGRYGAAGNLPPEAGCNCPGDPRRVVKIAISGSWDIDQNGNSTPGHTNVTIWNAFNHNPCAGCPVSATQLWNNARDGQNASQVYFQLDQGNNPDIIIKLGTPVSGCASTDITKKPYVMTLPPEARFWSPEQIAALVAHELGHTIGLGHALKDNLGPDCAVGGIESIMRGYRGACQPIGTTVQPIDVAQHNAQYNGRLVNCRVSTKGGLAAAPPGGGGGGGGTCANCQPTRHYCYDVHARYVFFDGSSCYDVLDITQQVCDGFVVSYQTYSWEVCTTIYY